MEINRDLIMDFQLHPLGFFYLILASGTVTSRLHVYPSSSILADSNDWHTHEFDLRSRVLVGSLGNEIGRFIVGGDKGIDEYLVEYCDDRSSLRPTGRSGEVVGVVNFTTSSGDEYFIRSGVIHRARGIVTPCVTHVEMTHAGEAIFSYGRDEAPFTRRRATRLEASEIFEILDDARLVLPS